jgi:transcriptional regulator with XRE-family HTH domain
LIEICRRLGLPLPLTTGTTSRRLTALARARERAGLSGSELARRLVVSRSLLSLWERGQRSPHPRYYPGLAAALAIDEGTVADMFQGAPTAKADVWFIPGLGRERRAIGLTQDEFARCAEVHVSTVVAWESCRKPVSRHRVMRLAELLDTSATRLLTGQARQASPIEPLARIRKEKGSSRREVAALLGIPTKKLQRIESQGVVPDELAGALAQVYGISRKDPERVSADALGADGSNGQDPGDDWLPYTAYESLPLWTCLFESLSAADRRWILKTLRRYVPHAPTCKSASRRGARAPYRERSR